MTNLPGKDVNRIPCGRCCPPPPGRVRVRPDDDQSLLTDKCPEDLRREMTPEDIAENGDRVLRLRTDGRCEWLSLLNTHCLLVDGDTDRRPFACRDGWPDKLCADMGCPKLEKR